MNYHDGSFLFFSIRFADWKAFVILWIVQNGAISIKTCPNVFSILRRYARQIERYMKFIGQNLEWCHSEKFSFILSVLWMFYIGFVHSLHFLLIELLCEFEKPYTVDIEQNWSNLFKCFTFFFFAYWNRN